MYKSNITQSIRLCVVSRVPTGKQELQHACKEGHCDRKEIVSHTFLKSGSALLSVNPPGMAFSDKVNFWSQSEKKTGKFGMASMALA